MIDSLGFCGLSTALAKASICGVSDGWCLDQILHCGMAPTRYQFDEGLLPSSLRSASLANRVLEMTAFARSRPLSGALTGALARRVLPVASQTRSRRQRGAQFAAKNVPQSPLVVSSCLGVCMAKRLPIPRERILKMSRSYKVRIFEYEKVYRSHRTIAHLRGSPRIASPAAGVAATRIPAGAWRGVGTC
jgi:hypothetical protein